MTIRKMGTGGYADYQLADGVLTIADKSIDLRQEQQDSQVIIDIKDGEAFVANIEIPPKKYREVEIKGRGISEEGMSTEYVAEELDIEAVTLILWPVVDEENNTIKEGEDADYNN